MAAPYGGCLWRLFMASVYGVRLWRLFMAAIVAAHFHVSSYVSRISFLTEITRLPELIRSSPRFIRVILNPRPTPPELQPDTITHIRQDFLRKLAGAARPPFAALLFHGPHPLPPIIRAKYFPRGLVRTPSRPRPAARL
jgi:hypothetical protein